MINGAMAKTIGIVGIESQYAAIGLGLVVITTFLTCLSCRRIKKEDDSDDVVLEMESLLQKTQQLKETDHRQRKLAAVFHRQDHLDKKTDEEPETPQKPQVREDLQHVEEEEKDHLPVVGKTSLKKTKSAPLLKTISFKLPEIHAAQSMEDTFLAPPHQNSDVTSEDVPPNNTDTSRNSVFGRTFRNISSHKTRRSMEDISEAPPQPEPHMMTKEVQPNNTDTSRLSKFGKSIRDISSHILEEIQPNHSDLHPRNEIVRDEDDVVGYSEDVGTLHFAISYDLYEKIFKVAVQKAVGLAAKDKNGLSDPFCKVYLNPGKKQKIETKVIRKNLNPVWHETLTFEGFPLHILKQRVLRLKVLDFDSFSKNDPIGDVEVALANATLQADPIQYIRRLRPNSQSASARGEILLSLAYDQRLGHISVTVLKCRNLKVTDVTGNCNPYVKVYTYYSGHRVDKKRTKVHKHGKQNPEWNETLEFELPLNRARDVMFVFRVMDFDPILMNRPMGDAYVGYRTGAAQSHWYDMLNQPKTAVSMWHTLKKPKKYGKISFS